MVMEPQVESERLPSHAGVRIKTVIADAGEEPIARLTKFLDRRSATGTTEPIEGGVRWSLKDLHVDLIKREDRVEVTMRESWASHLRGARNRGLGQAALMALLIMLLPLSWVLAPVMVSLGITNLLSDVTTTSAAIKLVIIVIVLFGNLGRQRKLTEEGLEFREQELTSLAKMLPEALREPKKGRRSASARRS